MNRWYTTEQYYNEVEFIRSYLKDAAITTDIIVGFPGETDDDFEETIAFVERIGFARIHVFPFSPRPNTKAYDMKDKVPNIIKSKRVHRLIELGEKLEINYIKRFVGSNVDVLFEASENDYYVGYSKEYVKVKVKSDIDIRAQIHKVMVTGHKDNALISHLL